MQRREASLHAMKMGATHVYVFQVWYRGMFIDFSVHYVKCVDDVWCEVGYYSVDMSNYTSTNDRETCYVDTENMVITRGSHLITRTTKIN